MEAVLTSPLLRQPVVALPSPEGVAVVPVARPLLPTAAHILPYLQRIDAERLYSNFGPLVDELEQRLAERTPGVGVCTVANATQGLTLSLKAMAPQGGLCLIPGFTFVATAHAAMQAGLTPYLLDVDPQSWMITPEATARAIGRAEGLTRRSVAAIVVVAAFGAMPDVEGFAALARETGVPVILDAAAAFDSLASSALPAVVSLHATKALGAGEGGYVVSDDPDLIRRLRSLSGFGFAGARRSMTPATNAKMSEYTAAVAMAALDGWPAARMRWMLAARKLRLACYRREIGFQDGWGETWVGSTCVARTADGAAGDARERLASAGVDTRAWWGEGLHREPAFADCPRDPLPAVERLAASTLGLPFALDLADAEIATISKALA